MISRNNRGKNNDVVDAVFSSINFLLTPKLQHVGKHLKKEAAIEHDEDVDA
jgi:hypothetical protein